MSILRSSFRCFAVARALARRSTSVLLALSGFAGCGSPQEHPSRETSVTQQALSISFAQLNYATPQTDQTTVNVPFKSAQTAGNLNVVVVGWNDTTANVTSVTDTSGNQYRLAVGPTKRTTLLTQSIYYAANIAGAAANANSVKVTFSVAATWVDVRVAEYAGIDPVNPVDVVSAASGRSATSSTPAVTTTNANDLLVSANMVTSLATNAGAGWTKRVITQPDGDLLQDKIVAAAGANTSTSPLYTGDWVMQMVAFRAVSAGPDTQPPSAPGSLAATAASSTQINLSWTAATDNVGVTGYQVESCAGAGCTNFAQIATAAGTTFSNTGLAPSTPYSYRVRATDAAGNTGAYSNTATATTQAPPDTQPPTAPGNLVATGVAMGQINLSWTAATDDVGVNLYLIERCAGSGCSNFAGIGTTSGTSFSDSGLSPSATFTYRVRANDLAGNLGPYSNTAAADAVGPPDTQPPSAPSNVVATAATGIWRVDVTWTASSDNVGVTSYLIDRCAGAGCTDFAAWGTAGSLPAFQDSAVQPLTSYSYRVRATDAAGNVSDFSNIATATTPPDTTPPTVPSNLVATLISTTRIDLSWTASTDDASGFVYHVESCAGAGCTNFAEIGIASAPSFSNTALPPSTTFRYRVRAVDFAGNASAYSAIATAATPDTQPPTAPSGLGASAVSVSQINLGWSASTDDTGVTAYLVESCAGAGCSNFAQIASVTGTTYNNASLAASTSYSYRVRARDAAGNQSGYSNVASATTLTPDTQPPTSPSGLTAVASSGQINLAWTAATDDTGVTAYLVERCQGTSCSTFAQVGTTAATTYANTGLSASTSYSYRVRASDAAGNLGAYSNVASATTPAAAFTPTYVQGNYATPQSAPASVAVTYPSAQWAGDLNVVVVGWNDSDRTVTSVSDTKGNTYQIAVGPTVIPGVTQTIYYAANIRNANAGENKVTVTFNGAAQYPDIRIHEYRGIAASSPVDASSAGTGSNATSNAGSVTTTNAIGLLFAANTVQSTTTAAGAGYTTRFITSPNGDLSQDRMVTATGTYPATAPLSGAGGWVMQLVAFKASPTAPPADRNPPTVAVTSPASGVTLSGTVTVTVTASDAESGIEATQALVDGVPASMPDPSSPYSMTVDTTKFSNGSHVLGATGLDSARNIGYAPGIPVTFSNASPGNPAAIGLFSGLISLPLVPVHQALMPDGKILVWDGQSDGIDGRVWDTGTNAVTLAPPLVNEFCSAHEQMADGRIFVAGGHNGGAHWGITAGTIFDPVNKLWSAGADMSYPRWYPTVTALSDGRMFVMSGETSCPECYVKVPEIYDPRTNVWLHLTDAPFEFPYYPHMYVLPDGRVLVPSTSEDPIVSQVFDLNTHVWTAVGGPAVDGGSSVMYLPGKIMKAGTSVDPDQVSFASANTAYVLDMNQPSPTWRAVAPMAYARTYGTLTMLPDGTVLMTGGGPTTAPVDTARAIRPIELWSPTTETWTTLGSMSAPRLYHSAALLMPDARVVILGGGRFDDATYSTDQFNAEFYSPPYLFKGPRPAITSAPATIPLGLPFTVQTPDAARIAKVSLIRYGSVTHTINMSQRFVPLTFTAGSGFLTVDAPANANIATPGNYMLFLVDTNGVPSIAATVRL